jgi:hypothetical protein
MLKVGLALGLVLVRDRTLADATINEAFVCTVVALDQDGVSARSVFLHALEALIADPHATRLLHWTTTDALTTAAHTVADVLDEDAERYAQSDIALDGVEQFFTRLFALHLHFERFVQRWYTALELPRSAKNSRLIDVALLSESPPMRTALLAFLARRAVDIRGVIAADATLSAAQRVVVLSLLATHRLHANTTLESIQLHRELASVCADWTRYVTHPRVLFWHLRQQCDATQLAAIFQQMRRWPLSLELREQLKTELALAPVCVEAQPLSTGRWRCGRCDSSKVYVTHSRALDNDDPARGAEVSYQCTRCKLVYHSAWEPHDSQRTTPQAWVGL